MVGVVVQQRSKSAQSRDQGQLCSLWACRATPSFLAVAVAEAGLPHAVGAVGGLRQATTLLSY